MKTKIAILVSGILCFVGIVIMGVGFATLDFSLDKLFLADDFVDKTYETVLTDVNKIDLSSINHPIIVRESTDGLLHFSYVENGKYYFEIANENGTLRLKNKYRFDWKDFYCMFQGFGGSSKTLILELPKEYQDDLSVYAVNSELEINLDHTFSSFSLETVNGEVKASQVSANTTAFKSTNGKIQLHDIHGQKLRVSTVNGKVNFSNVDFLDLNLSTVNGDIKGSLYGDKMDYNINLSKINGKTNMSNQKVSSSLHNINASTVNGDIFIDFISEERP